MGTAELSWRTLRRTPQACGAASVGIGAAALVGWATKQPLLLGLRANYIPMAPNTALAFLILGAGLFAIASGQARGPESLGPTAGRKRWGGRFAGLGAALVGLIAGLRLSEYATGVDLAVDRWFFRLPAAEFGLAPVGKMAFATAAAFVAAAAALGSLAWPDRWRSAGDFAGGTALLAGATGLVFSLGYLFSPNAPLLYGTQSIPMALNTALGFVALGVGLVATAGPGAFPLRRLSGPSTRARLLRVFLPLVVATVGGVAWLTHVVTMSAGASSAAISSAALATAAILMFGLICEWIAGRIGEQLERAEAELRRAHDELEVKVQERTQELSRANAELGGAFDDLREAHEALQGAHLDLKQAQGRMLQQARLASLGQTAAGVAHEINNPLAFIANNIVILKREVTGLHNILLLYQKAEQTLEEYQRELLGQIRDLAEEVDLPYVLENLDGLMDRSRDGLMRIQKIVADLRDFAHLDEADIQEADLNAGIVATVTIMRSLADKRQVVLQMDLTPIPRLTCFAAKMNLVIQNLISNAIDACPPGGKVVVRTRPADDGAMIEVSDTGCGISPAIQEKVFDPFFTTKPIGQGTGLGLSMSYGIVKDHGGMIDFESIPGRGTRFTIRLPSTPPSGALQPGLGSAVAG